VLNLTLDKSKEEIAAKTDEVKILKEKLIKVEPLCQLYIKDNVELKKQIDDLKKQDARTLIITDNEIKRIKEQLVFTQKEKERNEAFLNDEISKHKNKIDNRERMLSNSEIEIKNQKYQLEKNSIKIKQLSEERESVPELEEEVDTLNEQLEEVTANLVTANSQIKNLRINSDKNTNIINSLNDEIKVLKQVPKAQSIEQVVVGILNKESKIHESILKYFLKVGELEREFSIGKTTIRKIHLGNGFYKLEVK